MNLPGKKRPTRDERVAANNEWMRRFIEEPDKFEREWQTVQRFVDAERAGEEPTYGERCVAYEESIVADLRRAKKEGRKDRS